MKKILANNRYKICSGHDVARIIKKGLEEERTPLSNDQYFALIRFLGDGGTYGNLDMDFQMYSWEKEKKEGKNMLWRMTVPLFFLYAMLYLLIVYPIHWVVTGKYQLDMNNPIGWFNWAWYHKIFK